MSRYCLTCEVLHGKHIEFTSWWQIYKHIFTEHLFEPFRIKFGGPQ